MNTFLLKKKKKESKIVYYNLVKLNKLLKKHVGH